MKLYKTKKNCGKLLLGILAFCTGMILLTGCGVKLFGKSIAFLR